MSCVRVCTYMGRHAPAVILPLCWCGATGLFIFHGTLHGTFRWNPTLVRCNWAIHFPWNLPWNLPMEPSFGAVLLGYSFSMEPFMEPSDGTFFWCGATGLLVVRLLVPCTAWCIDCWHRWPTTAALCLSCSNLEVSLGVRMSTRMYAHTFVQMYVHMSAHMFLEAPKTSRPRWGTVFLMWCHLALSCKGMSKRMSNTCLNTRLNACYKSRRCQRGACRYATVAVEDTRAVAPDRGA